MTITASISQVPSCSGYLLCPSPWAVWPKRGKAVLLVCRHDLLKGKEGTVVHSLLWWSEMGQLVPFTPEQNERPHWLFTLLCTPECILLKPWYPFKWALMVLPVPLPSSFPPSTHFLLLPLPLFIVLGLKPRASCMEIIHSTNRTPSLTRTVFYHVLVVRNKFVEECLTWSKYSISGGQDWHWQ